MREPVVDHHWEKIMDAFNDALMIVGDDGKIVMVNAALERITGYPKEELIGAPCTLLDCDACEVFGSEGGGKWCMLFATGSVKEKRCLFLRKDGSGVAAVKNASILTDQEGKMLWALEIITDISELERRDLKIRELSELLDGDKGFHGMVGKSTVMQALFQVIEKAALSDAPVMIYGESGTGKELVASAVHRIGRRREKPFIHVKCDSLNESLLESELFGHIKGAFPGAHRHRVGFLESAHGGDIFLDEIGEIPLSFQSKLLRVLETKEFERVGDNRPIRVDVRVIASTNRNLLELASRGKFRQDLFFRLNVFPVYLPPLRERKSDIPLLVDAFIRKLRKEKGKDIQGVSPGVMKLFMGHEWPGNVRELKTTLEYGFVVSGSRLVDLHHLPAHLAPMPTTAAQNTAERALSDRADETVERTALIEALRQTKGNKTRAAEILGVHRMTVLNRMKKYGIQLKQIIEG